MVRNTKDNTSVYLRNACILCSPDVSLSQATQRLLPVSLGKKKNVLIGTSKTMLLKVLFSYEIESYTDKIIR